MLTPPRSPGGDKLLMRTFSPKMSNQLLFPDLKSQGGRDTNDSLGGSRGDPNNYELSLSKESRAQDKHGSTFSYNENWSKTDGALSMAQAFKKSGGETNLPFDSRDNELEKLRDLKKPADKTP